MDIASIDQAYTRLDAQANQTQASLRALNDKLQAASGAGDANAREWSLDLREVALAIREEQQQVGALLQALHDFVVHNAEQPVATAQPVVQAAPVAQLAPAPAPSGGLLSRFMGGGFGQAIAQGAGMGVGFGIGESVIDDIFG